MIFTGSRLKIHTEGRVLALHNSCPDSISGTPNSLPYPLGVIPEFIVRSKH